jgi:hypothetical protein
VLAGRVGWRTRGHVVLHDVGAKHLLARQL